MKIVRNSLIPFKGFAAINLFEVLFVRREVCVTERLINHERIHSAQMRELGYAPFYIAYLCEWAWRLFLPGNAYRQISFEREAYANEHRLDYLANRKPFAQWKR